MGNFEYFLPDENGFKGGVLDQMLAGGYYRSQHCMFTTNDTCLGIEDNSIPVFWLRTLVNQCSINKSAETILKRCSKFTVNVQPAHVDDEVESLYEMYKEHVPFTVSSSCTNYLHMDLFANPFESMMIQVRDKDLLIANGYFDKGLRSMAGIMNIYHPQYKSFSPGKFLILQKLHYALINNIAFYYTGYISPGSSRFDYKTFPDPTAVEVLLPDQQLWVPYKELGKEFLAEYYLKNLV